MQEKEGSAKQALELILGHWRHKTKCPLEFFCLIESHGEIYHLVLDAESTTYECRRDGVECLEPKEEGREGGAKFTVPLSREGSSLPRPLVPSFFWPFRTPTHPLAPSPGQLSLKALAFVAECCNTDSAPSESEVAHTFLTVPQPCVRPTSQNPQRTPNGVAASVHRCFA